MMEKIIFLLISGLLFLNIACQNELPKIAEVIPEELIDQELATEVELIYSDSAIIRVIVMGDTMITHTKNRSNAEQEFPAGIKVDFYGPSRRVQSELTSKYAIRYEAKKQIVIRDSVVWKSKEPEILETEELIWDERDEKVFSKRFVKITTPEDVFYGYGFEADQEFKKWKILAPMGEMQLKELGVE